MIDRKVITLISVKSNQGNSDFWYQIENQNVENCILFIFLLSSCNGQW